MSSLQVDLIPLLPALSPLAGVVVVLFADVLVPRLRRAPYVIAALASLGGVAATVPGLAQVPGDARETLCVSANGAVPSASALPGVEGLPQTCFWQADSLTSSLQLAASVAALVCIALAWPRTRSRVGREGAREPVEAVLFLTALAGAVVVAAARDLGTWLVALELATLPVIALVALSGRRMAVAGAIQLLVTSLVSFALLALGVALWFVATGSPLLIADSALLAEGHQPQIAGAAVVAWPSASTAILALSVVVVIAGLAFKLSLVPFHAWTPTAYAGSATAVATFLATVSKIAALGALLVVVRAVSVLGPPGLVAIAVLSALSMTFGNIMALRQNDVIRLLAWSTVAQAGWVIMPLVNVSSLASRAAATYLLTYVAATLVAFAVAALIVRERPGTGRDMSAYEGLWHRSPWRAGAFALALTSLAGLPPGIIGLVGKVVALQPVLAEGWIWLAIIAAANAVLGVAAYLRWLRPVLTRTGASDEAAATRGPGHRRAIAVGLALSAAILVVLSVQPDALLRLLG